MPEMKNPTEQALASAMLFAAAGKASASLDAFASWLLGGYAAVVALLVGHESGGLHLPGATMRALILHFVVIAVIGISAKFLSIIVTSGSEGSKLGREMVTELIEGGVQLDIDAFMAHYLSGIPQPGRWLVQRMTAPVKLGKLMDAPRLFILILSAQGVLTLLQIAIILWTICRVASDATF